MFQRESEGVYLFGTKRVNIRVDNNNINVRVGGGYLSIEEFIDQYTPSELERLSRQDPLKKLTDKVLFMQKLPTMTATIPQRQTSEINASNTSPRVSMVQDQTSPQTATQTINSQISPMRKTQTLK